MTRTAMSHPALALQDTGAPHAAFHYPAPHGAAPHYTAEPIGHALSIAGSMTWEIAWALILGFGLSS